MERLTSILSIGTYTGKAVLLEDIISNVRQNSAHYQHATLSFIVGELQHQPLVELFRAKDILRA